jgi:paired amphipathic helix protein Sin3a
MSVRVSLGTYKLFYEAGTEDYLSRTRNSEDELTLGDRAKARHEERKKCRLIQM